MNEDDIFNPELWASLQEEERVYTTPIKKRLRARALEKEEQLLRERALATERALFWRDDAKHLTGRSTPIT